jgi:hypothetical protein
LKLTVNEDGGGDESCCEVKKAKNVITGWWSRVVVTGDGNEFEFEIGL